MSYSCQISCDNGIKEIFEQEAGVMGRSSLSVERKSGKTVFSITAKDAAALKASVNTVIKALTIYEKSMAL